MLGKIAGVVLMLICWGGIVNLTAWLSPQTILMFEVAFIAWCVGWCCGNEEIRSSALKSIAGLKSKPGEATLITSLGIYTAWFLFELLKSLAPLLLAFLCATLIANVISKVFSTVSRRLGR